MTPVVVRLAEVIEPVRYAFPTTERLVNGEVVPIPKLPLTIEAIFAFGSKKNSAEVVAVPPMATISVLLFE